jgi:hypothetical protein
MGKRLRGGDDKQPRNGNLIIADLVGSIRHLGAITRNAGPRMRLRGLDGGTQEEEEANQK